MGSCCLSWNRAARTVSPKLLCAQMFSRSYLEGYHWQAAGRCGHWTGTLTSRWCSVPVGQKGQMFPMAHSRYLPSEALLCRGLALLFLALFNSAEDDKMDQEAGQQASVRSAICSQYAYLGLPNTQYKIRHPWRDLVAWRYEPEAVWDALAISSGIQQPGQEGAGLLWCPPALCGCL